MLVSILFRCSLCVVHLAVVHGTYFSYFQSDSVGGEVSRIYYVGFKGETRELRKDADTKLEIRAANASDAPLVDRVTEKMAGQQTTAR